MNKIHQIAILLVFIFGIGMSNGCADLQPVDYSDIQEFNFPKTEEDIKSLVLSCYYPLRSNWFDGIFSRSERGINTINDVTTEILTSTWNKQISEHDYHSEMTDVTWFYYSKSVYGFLGFSDDGYVNDISNCTLVIDQIERSNLSQESKDKYIGEVRCARGFLSYILYDMYGPLVVAPLEILKNPLKEEPLPRLSKEDMVKFIEEDLLFAAEKLPFPDKTEYGKFSRGLAKMLLIRLYLHETPTNKAYYDKVEELSRELMNADYGYQLQASYPKMFEVNGQGVANKEIIWAIPCLTTGRPGEGNDWHMFVLPTDFNQGGMKGGYNVVWSPWSFYDSFEANDTRKTYLLPEYMSETGELITRNELIQKGVIPMKFGYDPGVAGVGRSVIDIIIYRYADVLLSLAEALALKPTSNASDLNEALAYINQVRQRANLNPLNLPDVNTPEKFITALLTERAHEFWCENGQYRADLIRHNKFATNGNKTKELFPLPKMVITDGKGKVEQNPGY